MKRILSFTIVLFVSLMVAAQAPRTAYHTDGFMYGHELNPAFQPDSSYMSLPLLGNTAVAMGSSMKMEGILFNKPGDVDKLTLFTAKGTISKAELMEKVGKGMNTNLDVRLTLISLGWRVNEKRYRTIEAVFRNQASVFVPKSMFSIVKDVENGSYIIDGMNIDALSFVEASYGESFRLNDKLTVGGKVKLLGGILNADANIKSLKINVEGQGEWTTQGYVCANLSGLEYENKIKEYSNRVNPDGTPKTYESVNGVKVGGLGLNGLGLAIDAGAEYKLNNHFSFSAAVRDVGFISWFKSHKAENSGETFVFNGFRDISTEGETTLENQWNVLKDDFLDMIHIEDKGTGSHTKMLSCTAEASAKYKYKFLTAGLLFSSYINGDNTWLETRLNLGFVPLKRFDIVVSPTYGTYGFSVGAMLSYRNKGFSTFIASDRLFYEVNKQMIPTSLNAALQFGMTFSL